MKRDDLVDYLNQLLAIDEFNDYAPNGLQVEGKAEINKVVLGVTASQALIEQAVEHQADMIIVHHGYFWKNEPQTITGIKYQRIKRLIDHRINLVGYHLPLDAHPKLGNNAQLGKCWGLTDITPQPGLVRLGKLAKPMSIELFIKRVATTLNRNPLHLPGGPKQVETISWCSGGAQGYIQQAIDWRADVYISGEVSEQTTHIAAESGIHYLAAGHHATETWGVKALADHLKKEFNMDVVYIETPNPV